MDSEQRRPAEVAGIRDVEDLQVFRKAYAISLEVHRASLAFPKVEQFGLAEQMRRASRSICANMAEGVWQAWRREYRNIARMLMGLHHRWG